MTLMDLRLPDGTGIEAVRRIRREFPAARVLMLTTFDGDEDIHCALEAGACGYLLKSVPGPELLRAIEAAALEEVAIFPQGSVAVCLRVFSRGISRVWAECFRGFLFGQRRAGGGSIHGHSIFAFRLRRSVFPVRQVNKS